MLQPAFEGEHATWPAVEVMPRFSWRAGVFACRSSNTLPALRSFLRVLPHHIHIINGTRKEPQIYTASRGRVFSGLTQNVCMYKSKECDNIEYMLNVHDLHIILVESSIYKYL